MQITTRPFQDTDLGRCLEIERAAVRSNHYLNDVIDYYRTTKGEFTLALADNFPAGMGKLTVLYDGSAWLELLRVHPDFQRQGMGKAIYRRYLEQVAAFGCPPHGCIPASKTSPAPPWPNSLACTAARNFAG